MTELVVFDTNIWVSGLLWRGAPYGCLLLARAGAVIPAYCNEMVAELAEKLRTKFAFSDGNVQAVIRDYRQVGRRVEITGQVKVVADDPTDDKFVECALVAGAARIVSGDRHLLNLVEYQGVKIVTAATFLTTLRQSR